MNLSADIIAQFASYVRSAAAESRILFDRLPANLIIKNRPRDMRTVLLGKEP